MSVDGSGRLGPYSLSWRYVRTRIAPEYSGPLDEVAKHLDADHRASQRTRCGARSVADTRWPARKRVDTHRLSDHRPFELEDSIGKARGFLTPSCVSGCVLFISVYGFCLAGRRPSGLPGSGAKQTSIDMVGCLRHVWQRMSGHGHNASRQNTILSLTVKRPSSSVIAYRRA